MTRNDDSMKADAAGRRGTTHPNPEVVAKPKRRVFGPKYKLSTLKKAEALAGDKKKIGALLRKEGLYSSHLSMWRKERERGTLTEPASKRGRPPNPDPKLVRENARLQREIARLQDRLAKAEAILSIQKKACSLLGMTDLDGGF